VPGPKLRLLSKDGLFFERGKRPMSQKEKGQAEETRWRDARQAALTGDFVASLMICILVSKFI